MASRNISDAHIILQHQYLQSKEVITGIYKIVSPSGKIYVGQSINIKKRQETYSKYPVRNQARLYNSINKYGWNNHVFEVIELCDELQLNDRERYWQDYYQVIGPKGLNCKLTNSCDKSGKLSSETKQRISEGNKGRKKIIFSDNVKKILSEKMKKYYANHRHPAKGRTAWNKGKKDYLDEAAKQKMIATHKGKKHSAERIAKNAASNTGKKRSDETKRKISEAKKLFYENKRLANGE